VRRAAKADATQAAIVDALRRIGAAVKYIKEPVDLIVGYRKRNVLMEVKNRDGKDELTQAQIEFIATWPGEVHVVYTAEEAVAVMVGAEAMK
jgi:hypothetical protein